MAGAVAVAGLEAKERVAGMAEEGHGHHRNPVANLIRAGTMLEGGRWRVVQKIGGGGFGQIYLAKEEGTGTEAGVKAETLAVERESLATEAKVLRSCQDSPHFPRYYGLGVVRSDGYAYLIMELLSVNLSELRRLLKAQRFSGNTLRRIGTQCVDALRHLHAKNFVHRDIKPSNWAIGLQPDSQRVVKLIDFGLARRWANADGTPKAQRSEPGFRGTVRYASLRAHSGLDLGRCDDLVSLFYMLVELVSGALPWRRLREKDAVAAAKQEADIITLINLVPDTDPDVIPTRNALRRFHDALQPPFFTREPPYARLKTVLLHRLSSPDTPFDWERIANLRQPLRSS